MIATGEEHQSSAPILGGATGDLICQDWRHAPAEMIEPLYVRQAERWSSALAWDSSSTWIELERGRRDGTVLGHVVTDDDGVVRGWNCHVVRDRTLTVNGFISSNEAVTRGMLDAIFTDDLLCAVDRASFFAFTDAPGLPPLLRGRGLRVERYWYLARDTKTGVRLEPPRDARRWRTDDLRATADLLMRAYNSPAEARPFAPHGTLREWLEYVVQLTLGQGCGQPIPEGCFAVPAGSNRLAAVALMSRVSPQTAHLTQLAVDPQLQGRGLGALLLATACAAAHRQGCTRLTLLVGGRNSRARAVYEAAGFEPAASFLTGGSFQPRRSTSAAPDGRAVTFL